MIPLVVNTPDPMLKVRVMAVKDRSTEALKTLHKAGVLHVEESEELKPVDREAVEYERRKVSELLTDVDDALAYIPEGEKVTLKEDVEVVYTRPFDEIDNEVRLLCTKLSNMHQRVTGLNEEIEGLVELNNYLGPLTRETEKIRLRDLNFSGNYLFSRVFVLPGETYETLYHKLKDYLFEDIAITLENEAVLYAIAKVEDQKAIETIVKEGNGKILEIPDEDLTLRDFLGSAEERISNLKEESTKLYEELESKTKENAERLVLLREALLAENERLSVLEKACEAKYVTLIEGWIPEASAEDTISEVKESVDYVFVDTRKPEEAEEPPTKLRNIAGIKPFQVVINLFGTPKYGEWDPTPIVAYSFALFFGLMMGDVVYAAIIMLFAYRGLKMFVDDPESEGVKLFQRTLYISSGVAMVIGVLTGTYLGNFYQFFGIESMALSEGVQSMLGNPLSFIVLSLIIGLVHLNIAHLLALIRGVKQRDKGMVLAKLGLFALQIGAIPWITHTILHVDIPLLTAQVYSILLYVMGVGMILIVAASIMQKGSFLGSIFWLFDVTGLLGDVMSYARLAGVGLATYYLAYCFNLMAVLLSGMVPEAIRVVVGPLLAFIILLIGHSINLVLSGITCFVHSLRLCFVEFLFKFYEGGGKEYSPFQLKTRPVFVKGKS